MKGNEANRKGGVDMAAEMNTDRELTSEIDEELVDVLIAISVIAKRLATKITENQRNKGDKRCTETTTD